MATMATTPTGGSEMRSATSYRSTQSSRSSVMERAREYSRKMDPAPGAAQGAAQGAASGTPSNQQQQQQQQQQMASPSASSAYRSQSAGRSRNGNSSGNSNGNNAADGQHGSSSHMAHQTRPQAATPRTNTPTAGGNNHDGAMAAATPRSAQSPSRRSRQNDQEQQEPVVSTELLVDALSGHEDGLLAIAEKLMEHYDSGYDVMGEAIIDAFSDVQKLFQHVVEAAHVEGAAFEASKSQEEISALKQQLAAVGAGGEDDYGGIVPFVSTPNSAGSNPANMRIDEFVDQDVKDCLTKAIREGTTLRGQNQHDECFALFSHACQSASSLLPVDSDHRARLQLSLERSKTMPPDRACAILRYAMDDVLRSGMRAGKVPLPDPSKRADVVLSKPKGHPSMNGSTGQAGVVQSSEEALNSLVEEMKEVISAPIYDNTPVRNISQRFWSALSDAQKLQLRNEERLEHNLGKYKVEYLLARAEWEEKLNSTQEMAETYKQKYLTLKGNDNAIAEDAFGRPMLTGVGQSNQTKSTDSSIHYDFASARGKPHKASRGVESVASIGSSMAQHARSLVGSFACSGINERTGGVLATELAEHQAQAQWREKRKNAKGAVKTQQQQYQDL